MPSWLFWVYARMMPELQAQDAISRINEQSFAAGRMDKRQSFKYIERLQRQAAGLDPNERVAARPGSAAELARLAGGSTRIILEG